MNASREARPCEARPPLLVLVDRRGCVVTADRAPAQARTEDAPRRRTAPWYEIFVERGGRSAARRWFAAALRGAADSIELPCAAPDETAARLRWQAFPLLDRNDRLGLLASRLDEASARGASCGADPMFEHAPVGLAEVGADGAFLRVNTKLCEMLGDSPDGLRQATLQRLTREADRGSEADAFDRLLAGRRDGCSVQTRFLRKDGTPLWVQVDMVSTPQTVSPRRILAVIADIEQRKRAEAALQLARDRMEQVLGTHVARQTVAAIAHELNQPLNAVCAYAEAALRLLAADDRDDARLRRALVGCADQAHRAGAAVRELTEFLARAREETEPIDLNDCVRTALAIVRGAGYGDFSARLDLDPRLRKVMASGRQVEKVLVNLLRNAVEAVRHMDERLSSIAVVARTSSDGAMAQVTVCDNGPGMDSATLARLFDPFFTTKPDGLGMGLPISRAMIESNGGRLWADVRAGEGACFHFTLPFAP